MSGWYHMPMAVAAVALVIAPCCSGDVAGLREAAAGDPGLVHHWTFEGRAPMSDKAGANDLHQVVIGRGYGNDTVAFREGADGSTQAMHVAFDPGNRIHGASLMTRRAPNLRGRPTTIELLFRAAPVDSVQYRYVLGSKTGQRAYLAYLPESGEGKTLATYVGDSGQQELIRDLKTGVWYYYAITLNGGGAVGDVYVGDVRGKALLRRIAVNSGDPGTFPRDTRLAIGGLAEDGSLKYVWCGAVDEVAVYARHLPEETIVDHFVALTAEPDGGSPAVAVETRVISEPVEPGAPRPDPEVKPIRTEEFSRYARAYADAMIAASRSNLPEPGTPLFPIALERGTHCLPKGSVGALNTARVPQEFSRTANPQHDMNLYQILYALTRFSGDPKYAREADRVLAYFLNNCQEPRYGFYCWGEHLGWDLLDRAPGGFPAENAPNAAIHEFYRPWIFWDKSYELAPDACLRYGRAIWRHQVNHEGSVSFSRHAMVLKGDNPSRRGYEFPRHGGFYISAWAAAYAHSHDAEMLEAVEQLVAFYESRRHPDTGAIPHGTADLEYDGDGTADEIFYTPSPLTLAVELHDAADKMPEPLRTRMLELARSTDGVFLGLPHDPGPGGKGFVVFTRPGDLRPREFWLSKEDIEKGRPPRRIPYTGGWRMGYVGQYPHAWLAPGLICRYRQTHHDGYRRLILACADNYVASAPDADVTAGTVGNVILLLNAAFRIGGDEKYLRRAEWFGRWAATYLWPDSSPLPLPSKSSRQNVYAASSRCDTLVMAMLDTWQLRVRPEHEVAFVPTDR